MSPRIKLLFIFAATLYCISILLPPYPGHWLVKMLPVALLIFAVSRWPADKTQKLFLTGLVFSVFGDFFLGYDSNNWFIFGLGAFFIAHIAYILALMPVAKSNGGKTYAILAYLAGGGLVLSLLLPGLGELLIPVIAYISILLVMAICALLSEKSNAWMVIGGLSFVASDALIGLNKFYLTIPQAQFFIMISYYFAQYALLQGFAGPQTSRVELKEARAE
ncbi:lysoplasmalogenase [Thalassomonas viridans]|uniref:Lysoplasmalogenase n=1 Tax=Thalassomonas viridans TaxID=137584 RepID=A0AAE9Z5H8_9GAMM|nr:lysoplasmalogenase [Thalassomonas viridans]WDE07121.1 lysoplasmalogenase [Thalassomonas viridans]